MSKEDLACIIVRATGLIFLVLLIVELPKLVSTITYATYLYPGLGELFDSPEGSGSAASLKSVKTMLVSNITQCLAYLIAACYFIFRGNFAKRLLLR